MNCYIVGAGEIKEAFTPEKGDFIIAADGGLDALKVFNINPDLIIGDFDSVKKEPQGKNIIKYPVMKDDTDTMLSVKEGIKRGFDKFIIYGAVGGRSDHTIANIQTLKYIASQGKQGFLAGAGEIFTVIKNSSITISKKERGKISVFALGEKASGVKIKNLLYEAEDISLCADDPMGVSNEFIGKDACIGVKDGYLLVIWAGNGNSIKGEVKIEN